MQEDAFSDLRLQADIGMTSDAQSGSQPIRGNLIDLPDAWSGRPGVSRILDNDRGIMWDVRSAPNVNSPWHKHLYVFAGVDLLDATFVVTDPSGSASTYTTKAGNMWILPKGLTHMETAISPRGRHMVVVDMKRTPAPAYSNPSGLPTGYAGTHATLVTDHELARQWGVTLTPDVEECERFHALDMFISVIEGGDLAIAEAGRAPEVKRVEPGQGFFLSGGVARKIPRRRALSAFRSSR